MSPTAARQLRSLQSSHQPPEQHVIVAVDDSTVTDTVADCGATATVVPCRAPGIHLPAAGSEHHCGDPGSVGSETCSTVSVGWTGSWQE